MDAARRHYAPRDRLSKRARRAAWEELRRRHEQEWRELVDRKRAELGLPPAKPGRPAG